MIILPEIAYVIGVIVTVLVFSDKLFQGKGKEKNGN